LPRYAIDAITLDSCHDAASMSAEFHADITLLAAMPFLLLLLLAMLPLRHYAMPIFHC